MDSDRQPENALERASRVGREAAAVGFDWPDALSALEKVEEEVAELYDAIRGTDAAHIEEEFGDLMFAMTSVARLLAIEPASALRAATEKFERRYERMTAAIRAENLEMRDMSIDELEAFWQRHKGD